MRHTRQPDELELPPDRYFIAGGDHRIRTLLGSGVVITLWSRARRTGAMAHFLPASNGIDMLLELDGHIGPDGLQRVLDELRFSQIDPADCVARICGGGIVVSRTDRVPSLNSGQDVGDFARRMLRACGLPIISESFYPVGRHQIVFDVSSGRVQARRIKPVVVAIDSQSSKIAPHPVHSKRPRTGVLAR
jgi:chemotaxis protein CheD